MKKLGEDLKRALSGLSYQNSGGNLSRREKVNVLDGKSKEAKTESRVKTDDTLQTVESDPAA